MTTRRDDDDFPSWRGDVGGSFGFSDSHGQGKGSPSGSRGGYSAGSGRSAGGGGGGGLAGGARRLFSQGDNPLDWALPLYRAFGIRVRIHIFFIIYIVLTLAFEATAGGDRLTWAAMGMASLFFLVLLHEYGHCFACRWVGGEADDILMWPLGGLASCRPPREWKASLITTLGGPGVNLALLPVFSVALLSIGVDWTHVFLFNPFRPYDTLVATGATNIWTLWLWKVHYVNFVLLAFNLLFVMYPLDGGRAAQELYWAYLERKARNGGDQDLAPGFDFSSATPTGPYGKSLYVATTLGLGTAAFVAILSLVSGQATLLGIAIFGGITCYTQRQQLRFAAMTQDDSLFAQSLRMTDEPHRPSAPSKAEIKREEQHRKDQEEEDRILSKIAASGMQSLSRRERAFLDRRSKEKAEADRARRG